MTRGKAVGLGVVLFVVAAGVAVTVLLTSGDGGRQAGGLDAAATTKLESALSSGNATQTISVIAAQDAATFDSAAAGRLASLHLSIQRSTFTQYDGYATVKATTTSGAWLLTLVEEAGVWKLSDTTRLN